FTQSAYVTTTEEKAFTEKRPFALTGDLFPKIIVRHDICKRWHDDNGILNIGILDFLLDDGII
ncbi:MAG: ATP-binding protein, partial [Oscillospiraceae bacterium]|nr:ATP-binding protein [Oscillospiraceae bacterium]